MEEGEPLGATPNDKLIITKVQNGTLAEGKLRIGDQIVKVNGTTIQDTNHFFKLLRFAPPVARLSVVRDEKKAEELEARVHIPADRAKLIQRRDGFLYQLVKIEWKPGGPKLGLGIKHYQNRVLVSRCDGGSLASQQLGVGDHIIDIDSKPVTDKDVARELLLKSLQVSTLTSEQRMCVDGHRAPRLHGSQALGPVGSFCDHGPAAFCGHELRREGYRCSRATEAEGEERTAPQSKHHG
ncbi:hypothetical protein L596_027694 [Steinernema carpocapsae]|uniref:PDZ domain-containing protein n=1 Tax=Steinernema carpocapsae TaxID=34508 RepID=A0A4U5LW91_STECR|nr:hypothetical protein L596_027694 [Steinernema carpocapsae]